MRVVDPGWARGDAPEQQKPGYQESQRELLELRERFSSVHSDQKASVREQALYEGVSSLGCFNNGQKSVGCLKNLKKIKKCWLLLPVHHAVVKLGLSSKFDQKLLQNLLV